MNFTVGCQPCDNFAPRRTDYYGGPVRHECYSPPGCDGAVSFCANCSTDHHSGGYQTCTGTWHTRGGPCPKCDAAKGGA